MKDCQAISPEVAQLLVRLGAFLDHAEESLAQARPEALVEAAGRCAQLCRELRRVGHAEWPSAERRRVMLGSLAARSAALQQAIGRAQARMEREIELLLAAGPAPAAIAQIPQPAAAYSPLTYDAGGLKTRGRGTGSTYA